MIRSLCFVPGEELRTNIPVKELSTILKNPNALLWLDFEAEPDPSAESILTGIFRFHPLAVDDALKQTHTPKVDDWGTYLYIVLNSMSLNRDRGINTVVNELDVFLGKNFVVTHHDDPIVSITRAWEMLPQDARYTSHGPDHLLYKIIDDVVAGYWPMVEFIDNEIDMIEDRVFTNPVPGMLEDMFALKRTLVAMRRVIMPQREVLNRLARDDFEVVDEKDRIFFRDIYDHLVRLHDLNESLRDLLSGAMEAYLSVINNRMNEVMKVLTIITTLFMPISFITGFFGMNFFGPVANLSNWTGMAAFIAMLLVVSGLPISMFIWMHKRKWI
jgi:magnesium transporter